MNSQPTATDYLQRVTHFISYTTLSHLKRYNFAFTTMAPTSKEHVHWTDEEITALVNYLYDH